MSERFIHLTRENIAAEHLCCALADKKHQAGVSAKKAWLGARFLEGHAFYKLGVKGKVFIEYAPLQSAWVPVLGENYMYIYCLWVAGAFKGRGHAKALLEHCLSEARAQGKAGVCVLSARKKKPFLADKKFFLKHGFELADSAGEYELLALSLGAGASKPYFAACAKQMRISSKELTIYYTPQCPYILKSINEVQAYCQSKHIALSLMPVDSLEKAKNLPCVFNNYAVFYNGEYITNQILSETFLKKKFG